MHPILPRGQHVRMNALPRRPHIRMSLLGDEWKESVIFLDDEELAKYQPPNMGWPPTLQKARRPDTTPKPWNTNLKREFPITTYDPKEYWRPDWYGMINPIFSREEIQDIEANMLQEDSDNGKYHKTDPGEEWLTDVSTLPQKIINDTCQPVNVWWQTGPPTEDGKVAPESGLERAWYQHVPEQKESSWEIFDMRQVKEMWICAEWEGKGTGKDQIICKSSWDQAMDAGVQLCLVSELLEIEPRPLEPCDGFYYDAQGQGYFQSALWSNRITPYAVAVLLLTLVSMLAWMVGLRKARTHQKLEGVMRENLI